MMQPAATDSCFKGGAEHPIRHTLLQLPQQRPGISLQQRTPHLPSAPTVPQRRVLIQGFIQGHRPQARQLIQSLLIVGRQGLLQPGEAWIPHQPFHPTAGRGSVPTPIGIQPQGGRGRQPLQQRLQQRPFLRIRICRHLPLHRQLPLPAPLLQQLLKLSHHAITSR